LRNFDDPVWQFLRDDQFIKWVYSPDAHTIRYWEEWMEKNPGQTPVLLKAREMARDLAYAERPVAAQELSAEIWTGIRKSIDQPDLDHIDLSEESTPPQHIPSLLHPQHRRRNAWYLAAACLAGLLFWGARMVYHDRIGNWIPAPSQNVANLLVKEDLDRVNQTTRNQEVYLVDGSRVVLQPGSGIRHAAYLQKDKREIYLQGNAFFDVAKDPHRPFYVYAGDLVVHVLGTSFTLTTNKGNGEVTIIVRSGKVAVSRKSDPQQAANQLILTKNEKIIYGGSHDLVPIAANDRDVSAETAITAPPIDFNFEEMPVVKIFQTLENAYGIPFHYDENVFSRCVLTTTLSKETFEEKLKIICEATGASYRIDMNGVFIEGKPCK
jgi:transmembrane sensor